MIKYSAFLVASLMILSGCGGGSSDSTREITQLSTFNTQNDIYAIQQSLINAGYTNASDIIELGNNTLAFTYYQNGNKHFVIYDNAKGEIISNIPSFVGDSVINNDDNSIIFDNGTKVNVNNYRQPIIETTPTYTYTRPEYKKMPKDMINDQLPSDQYVSRFVYSPKRQAAAVVIKYYDSEDIKGIYLYGLDSDYPILEKVIYEPEDSGENIINISFPSADKVNFVVSQYDWKYYYTYNQWTNKLIETNRINPSGTSYDSNYSYNSNYSNYSNYSNTNISSIGEQIKNDIESDYGAIYEGYAISPQGNGAIALAFNDMSYTYELYLYGISNNIATREKFLTSERSSISNLRVLSGGRYSYEVNGHTVTKSYL